jgi:hypothetical protein
MELNQDERGQDLDDEQPTVLVEIVTAARERVLAVEDGGVD